MTEYTLVVIIPNAAKEISYSLNLTGVRERYPSDYFAIAENCKSLREVIESKSFRQVDDFSLKRIIKEWTQDISEGLYRTTVRIDLPPKIPMTTANEAVTKLEVTANNPPPQQPKYTTTQIQSGDPTIYPKPKKSKLEAKESSEPVTDKRSTNNKKSNF